jgi:predicted nucleic acid-binding protein
MAAPRFLDTNILLRYFTADDPRKARRARALLERVERGEEKVATSTLIVFETVFTLQRTYNVPRAQVREMVRDVLSLPGVQLAGKRLCLQALDLYVQRSISFADAYSVVSMQSRGLSEVYTWDEDFDGLPGVARLEPTED